MPSDSKRWIDSKSASFQYRGLLLKVKVLERTSFGEHCEHPRSKPRQAYNSPVISLEIPIHLNSFLFNSSNDQLVRIFQLFFQFTNIFNKFYSPHQRAIRRTSAQA